MKTWRDRFEHFKTTPAAMYDLICVRSLVLSKTELEPLFLEFIQEEIAKNGEFTPLLKVAGKHIGQQHSAYEFVRILSLTKKASLDPLKGLTAELEPDDPYFVQALKKLSSAAKFYNDFALARQSIQKIVDAGKADFDCLEQWARLNLEAYSRDQKEEYMEIAMDACITVLKVKNDPCFKLRTLSVLSTCPSEKITEKFLENFGEVPAKYWINLLPQMTAILVRDELRSTIVRCLLSLANELPHMVIYALMPILMLGVFEPDIYEPLSAQLPQLVASTMKFSGEMVRMASSWWEDWSTALESAARKFVTDKDPMYAVRHLTPLHEKVMEGAESFYEVAFVAKFGAMLSQAYVLLKEYEKTKNMMCYHRAWTLYYEVSNKIQPILKDFEELDVCDVSPFLGSLNDSDLRVIGRYRGKETAVKISGIGKKVKIIKSKRLPRKLTILGSDGVSYGFLLKAHEDTRLDQRVMQLFDFMTRVVRDSQIPFSFRLAITTYRVLPLTIDCGLIGWVPNSQTLFDVIKILRTSNQTTVDIEPRRSLTILPDYDHAPVADKLNAFRKGCLMTRGDDIQRILLVYSMDSNDWWERRLTYTTSLAMTSMAGYILGLGDRHISNIMMNNRSGKLIHIDFGDCFEVAQGRSSFPEKVPFRLTRIMVKALEVSGIDGTLRGCMENVMGIFRDKKDEITTLIETWLADPVDVMEKIGDLTKIGKRIRHKLTGNDFGHYELDVKSQVNGLIQQATDEGNMVEMFQGWFPWW
jgi:FKBP12-rapamycin complex-associated protein